MFEAEPGLLAPGLQSLSFQGVVLWLQGWSDLLTDFVASLPGTEVLLLWTASLGDMSFYFMLLPLAYW